MPDPYFAGQWLTAATLDDLYSWRPRPFIKTADQLYASTTTLQNDEHMTCSLKPNRTYEVEVHYVLSGTAGDIQTAWSVPAGATGYKVCLGPAASSTDRTDTTMAAPAHNLGTLRSYGVNHATNYAGAREKGLIVTTDGGTLTIQHTQLSSNVAPSGLATNSWMTVREI